MNKCDCGLNYDKECLYSEDYNGKGCNNEIVDYYQDEEYGEAMQSLEDMLLGGDVD